MTACHIVAVLPPRFAGIPAPKTLAELVSLPWITSSPECGLQPQLEALFKEAGHSVPVGTMADTEGAVLGMVTSGLGTGLMRRDQAIEAERAGQGIVWNGWQGQTWLCWAGTSTALEVSAVAAVHDAVLKAWAQRRLAYRPQRCGKSHKDKKVTSATTEGLKAAATAQHVVLM